MKKLIAKITWIKIVVALLITGTAVAGWQIYLYNTQTWIDKLIGFFS
jgi:hypothetical protein